MDLVGAKDTPDLEKSKLGVTFSKMPEFGDELREAVLRQFGSQAVFASEASLSRGRVSQIIGGLDPSLGYKTVFQILSVFPNAADREQLYEAWRTQFAPAPHENQAIGTEEEIRSFLAAANDLVDSGAILTVVQQLENLWVRLAPVERQSRLALEVGDALIGFLFLLNRRPHGLRIAGQVREIARNARDSEYVATALWREATGLRTVAVRHPEKALHLFSHLTDYLSAWVPQTTESRQFKRRFSSSVERDLAVAVWAGSRSGNEANVLLRPRLLSLQRSMSELEEAAALPIGKEVEARLHIELGDFDGCRGALVDAANLHNRGDAVHGVKLALTTARMHIALVDRDAAIELLNDTLSMCEQLRLLHYHSEALRLVAEATTR